MKCRTRVSVLTLVVAFLSWIKLAQAETPADVLNEFGLLGTWSRDCAAGPTETQDRVIYKSWSFGKPRVAQVLHGPARVPGGREGLSNADEWEIRAALELDAENIVMVLAPIKRATKANGAWANLPLGRIVEQTIRKIDDKIQLIDWHAVNGGGVYVKGGLEYAFGGRNTWNKTEYQTPLREKCVD